MLKIIVRFVFINDNDNLINIRIWKYHFATKTEKKKFQAKLKI